jgi:hypothetical protein
MSAGGGNRRDVEVVITVRGGHTRIVIQEGLGRLIGGIFGGLGGGLGGGTTGGVVGAFVNLHVPELLFVALPAWYFLVFSGARTWFHYAWRSRQGKLEQLADRLASTAEQLILDTPSDPRR